MKTYTIYLVLLLSLPDAFAQDGPPVSYRDHLSLSWKRNLDTLYLLAESKLFAPIELIIQSSKDSSELASLLLPAKDSLRIVSYFLDCPEEEIIEKFADSIRFHYHLGHPTAIFPNKAFRYRLPVQAGKKHRIMQSFNGSFSHTDDRSRYAIDFDLKMGSPIFAAREGIVVMAIDRFSKQGGKELTDAANQIAIMHPDGTIAYYVHLKPGGLLVNEGDWVQKGQEIGFSGNTGFTTKPHLHFVVRGARNKSIPIYFEGYEGEILEQGQKVRVK